VQNLDHHRIQVQNDQPKNPNGEEERDARDECHPSGEMVYYKIDKKKIWNQ